MKLTSLSCSPKIDSLNECDQLMSQLEKFPYFVYARGLKTLNASYDCYMCQQTLNITITQNLKKNKKRSSRMHVCH